MHAILSGMRSWDFKGFSSLQELECSGGSLEPEVKLLSLQMHRLSDNKALASLNVFSNTCVTLGDFSSCVIDNVDTHKSRLRVLVFDLEEGESREYGCNVNTMNSFGVTKLTKWKYRVRRKSECVFTWLLKLLATLTCLLLILVLTHCKCHTELKKITLLAIILKSWL